MTDEINKIKAQVLQLGRQMVDTGLVAGTWGNISARLGGTDQYIVTPSGIPYHLCSLEDLVLVNQAGQVLMGQRRPSSELNLHLAVYQARSDVGAIVHTHSTYACALAVAGKPLPPILEELAQLNGGEVPVTRYATAGSPALAQAVLEVLGLNNAVLLANHGLVGLGRDLAEAFLICQVVEKCAQVYMLSAGLGQPQIIPPDEVVKLRHNFSTCYGQR